MKSSIIQRHLSGKPGDPRVVVFPGILHRCLDQVKPLIPTFKELGYAVSTIDYTGTQFDADVVIEELTKLVDSYLENKTRLVIFASSLGGMLTARVLANLRDKHGIHQVNAYVSAIVVDVPANGSHLVLAPSVPPVFNKLAGWPLRLFSPSEKANASYGAKVLKSFAVPPKDDEIEYPPGLSEEERKAHAEKIKAQALINLSGHTFTVWVDQIKWMLSTKGLPLPSLKGLNVIYLACVAHNITLHQPKALEAWRPYVHLLVEVHTPHCAYLQAQETWTVVVGECLRALTPPS